MLDWLLLQTTVVSLVILLMMIAKKPGLNLLGARGLYKLWLLIPVSFATSMLPQWSQSDVPLLRYVVDIKHASTSVAQPLLALSDIALAAWLVGVLVLLGALWIAHRRYVGKLTRLIDPLVLSDVNEAIKDIPVYSSRELTSPCIVGCMRPALVLPEDFQQRFSASQQKLILRHELVHKQRGDLFSNLVAQGVLALFWFNPLVWKGYQLFRQTQELACDQVVLAESDKNTRIDYAKAMLLCTQQEGGLFSSSLHYGGKGDLQERLHNIKCTNIFSSWRWVSVGVSLLLTLTIFHSVSADSGKEVEAVYAISRVEPLYPTEAVQRGLEGSVVLSFDIDREGRVENVNVVESNPANIFDKASEIALRQWLYSKPAKPVKGVLVQLDFELDEGPDNPQSEKQFTSEP